MEDKLPKNINLIIFTIIGISILAFIGLILYIVINTIPSDVIPIDSETSGVNYIYTSAYTYPDYATNVLEVKVYNNTWLNFDGDNDLLYITSSVTDTLSFWYNSSTSKTWQHVVNIGGTYYTNGTLNTPVEYPVYHNGTDYIFGKTDGSTFWEGSIDEIRIYEGFLNSSEINELYEYGR